MGKELAILVQPNVPLDDAELERLDSLARPHPTSATRAVQRGRGGTIRPRENRALVGNHQRPPPIENPQSKIENPRHPPLLIWAENPAPFFFTRDPIFRNAMENMARQTHAFVIANTIIPVDARGDTITNSAITLDPEGREVSRYDKIHLVPFGEYVPWLGAAGIGPQDHFRGRELCSRFQLPGGQVARRGHWRVHLL